MAVASAADLVADLRRFRLLPPEQLEALARDLAGQAIDARSLAGKLIRDGRLTPYQVNQLLQGRGQELLLGSYILLERLGEGGMGAVFKAKHQRLGRVAALKIIRKDRLQNEQAVRRFQREVRAAAQLSHPNIVVAYDADEVAGTHFMAMECIDGTDLARLVKEKGPLPVEAACDHIRQAALGLQHAFERGMVHRDVKPHNLLLTRTGVVKVLDMGLARLEAPDAGGESTSTLTQEGAVMGTPDYIAPEQARGAHDVDIRADLYSLGCTLYFLLTGRVPFPGGTLGAKLIQHQLDEPAPVEQLRPDVPPRVAAVVRKLMAKRPADRFQTPADLAAALASRVPIAAAPADPSQDTLPAAGPSPVGAAAGATPTATTTPVAHDTDATAAYAPPAKGPAPRTRRPRRLLLALAFSGFGTGAAALLLIFLPRPGSGPPGSPTVKDRGTTDAPPPTFADAEKEITNALGMKLVLVPAGKFTMGSPVGEAGRSADEGPHHETAIPRPFYMGAFPVTQQEYEQGMGKNPSWFSGNGGGKDVVEGLNIKRFPVENVSWDDATAFCAALNRQDGKRPAGWEYGLPTEAEWEYACRAGTTTAWSFGDSPEDIAQYGWCGGDMYLIPQEVDARNPNPWGLYDMHGTVWQWCADRYGKYQEGSVTDPKGAESGDARVLRGGCFTAKPSMCRSAHRWSQTPDKHINVVGFRVVLRPPAEPGKEITNTLGMKLVRIPPGKFRMGSPPNEAGRQDDEGPQHEVEITLPFYLGAYPVTQDEYQRVIGKNPSALRPGVAAPVLARCPVDQVTWLEAADFCEALNKLDVKKPAGWTYRLPTEAEWEYACRAGTTTAFSFGDDPKQLGEYGWYSGNAGGRPHEVGTTEPNPWGLYDMHGNVCQWCADWYDKYPGESQKDPKGAAHGDIRSLRGGSWSNTAVHCRSAYRHLSRAPVSRFWDVGLRVCLGPNSP